MSSFQFTKFSGGRFFLIFLSFFGSPAAFTSALCVLDLVLGGLGYDHALGIEARAACATGDLMELAAAQAAHLAAVELGELP